MWNVSQNVQSHSIILHQHVLVTLVTIIRVAYDKNTVIRKIIVQKYMIKLFGGTFDLHINCNIIHHHHHHHHHHVHEALGVFPVP